MCGMACGWIDMPFWTFFGATCMGKGVTKVTIQAMVCISTFREELFNLVVASIANLSGSLATAVSSGRQKVMYKFALQGRFKTSAFFSSQRGALSESVLKAHYCEPLDWCAAGDMKATRTEDVATKVARVFRALDTNGDRKLQEAEVAPAVSFSDGKFSLDSLDPGTGGILSVGNLWNGFIVGLVLFFVYSIVDQMAQSKQAEIDGETVDALEAELKKKK